MFKRNKTDRIADHVNFQLHSITGPLSAHHSYEAKQDVCDLYSLDYFQFRTYNKCVCISMLRQDNMKYFI